MTASNLRDSLPRMIYDFVARPQQAGVEFMFGACWYCGGDPPTGRGIAIDRWAGDGFGGYARATRRSDPAATHVCEACVFVCSRLSPVPGRPAKEGKKMGGNFRNYSHAAARTSDGVFYVNANKGETSLLVDFLRGAQQRGPWAMAVAETGQKHVVSTAPVNDPSSRTAAIAFEEQVVRVQTSDLVELVERMNALRGASGCSGDALATGTYHPRDLQRARVELERFENETGRRMRGSGVLELAAFLTSAPPKSEGR